MRGTLECEGIFAQSNYYARLIIIDIHNLLCAMSSRKVRET